jgi:hypothetical protein
LYAEDEMTHAKAQRRKDKLFRNHEAMNNFPGFLASEFKEIVPLGGLCALA